MSKGLSHFHFEKIPKMVKGELCSQTAQKTAFPNRQFCAKQRNEKNLQKLLANRSTLCYNCLAGENRLHLLFNCWYSNRQLKVEVLETASLCGLSEAEAVTNRR